jgi:quinol monooxygenase YgiN
MPGISKTVVSLKPGKMEDVTKFLDEKAGEINQLAGGLGFAVAVTGEDELTIIGLYEASQNARDAGEKVQKLFAEMAPFVAAPPNREVFSGAWFPAK